MGTKKAQISQFSFKISSILDFKFKKIEVTYFLVHQFSISKSYWEILVGLRQNPFLKRFLTSFLPRSRRDPRSGALWSIFKLNGIAWVKWSPRSNLVTISGLKSLQEFDCAPTTTRESASRREIRPNLYYSYSVWDTIGKFWNGSISVRVNSWKFYPDRSYHSITMLVNKIFENSSLNEKSVAALALIPDGDVGTPLPV